MYLSATTASAFVLTIIFNPIVSANPIEAQANPIEAREDDPCKKFGDRTFRILAIQAQGFSGIFSQTFEAKVEHDFDPEKRLAGPEISSCTIRTYGSGCKWTKPEKVPLGEYKVEHLVFNPLEPTDGYVKISGDGCKDQKLECRGRSGLVPIGDKSHYWMSYTKCAVEKPKAESDDSKFAPAAAAAKVADDAARKAQGQ